MPSNKDIKNSWEKITLNSSYNQVIKYLNIYQYTKVMRIDDIGQYRQSGEIIDIFSPINDKPIRLNFNGDKIDTIKNIDIATQLSESKEKIFIYVQTTYTL